jgi:hypothetical protein
MTFTQDVNPYLVQSSERQEPQYFTTETYSLLQWIPQYRVKVETAEFLDIQKQFQGFSKQKQLSEYQKVNENIFAWKYFAPYAVLESLKTKEDAWYKEGLEIFHDSSDFRRKPHRNRSSDRSPRDPLNNPFTVGDELEKRLNQEIFMTAQFCWWYKEIKKKYPEVWRKMKERFCENDEWNRLVNIGELQEYIPRRFLGGVGGVRSCYVKGVFPWTKLRDEYCCEFRCLEFPKWYTLWDCNLQIFQNNKVVSIPKIPWSNSRPTCHKTDGIWEDIKQQITVHLNEIAAQFAAQFPQFHSKHEHESDAAQFHSKHEHESDEAEAEAGETLESVTEIETRLRKERLEEKWRLEELRRAKLAKEEAARKKAAEAAAPVKKTVEQALGLTVPWNYYKVLKIDRDVVHSDTDIARAYRRLARVWHPDKYKESAEIDKKVHEECFKLIAEAYDTLKDENGRRQYNAQIRDGYRHPAWKTNGQCLTQAFLVFEKAFNNMAV